jgi:hypothetical protein
MKVHAPLFTPPPPPAIAPPATNVKGEAQPASSNTRMAFEESLDPKSGPDQPQQAGYKSRGGRTTSSSHRPPPTAQPSVAATTPVDTDEPTTKSLPSLQGLGSIVDIQV